MDIDRIDGSDTHEDNFDAMSTTSMTSSTSSSSHTSSSSEASTFSHLSDLPEYPEPFARVVSIRKNSPSSTSGLKPKDVIVAITLNTVDDEGWEREVRRSIVKSVNSVCFP